MAAKPHPASPSTGVGTGSGQAATKIVRGLRRGQITIPAEFREKLGLSEDSLLAITLRGNSLEITPVRVAAGPGSPWLKELYDLFAPVREQLSKYSEDGINEMIEGAVKEAREKRG